MRLPIIQGIIRRRILANFRVDPEVMQTEIPSRFRPKLQNGFIYSSYFSDETKFPKGTIEFDHALIMRNVEHQWRSADDLYV